MSNETYVIKGAQIKEVIDHLECGFDDDSDAMTVLMLQSLPLITDEPVCWLVETEEDPELEILPFTTIADDTHETIRAMLNAFPVYTHAQPTEQALKEARKQALEEAIALVKVEFMNSPYDTGVHEIVDKITELLK